MAIAKATWILKANDENVTIDAFGEWPSYGLDGEATVDLIAGDSSWSERRKGAIRVERDYFGKLRSASVYSLGGDVEGKGRNVKQALTDFASKVATEIVQQRRVAARGVRVEAAAVATELARALTSLRAAGANDLADQVQLRLDAAIATRDAA